MLEAMRRLFQLSVVIILAVGVAALLAGCRPGTPSTTADETPDTSTYKAVPTPATEFAQKLKFARDAHFTHIWVFTRKDGAVFRSEEHTSELQSHLNLVCRLLLEKKKRTHI